MFEDLRLWGFIIATVIVKLLLSKVLSVWRAIATGASGILAALVMTEPTIHWLGIDESVYYILVACLWTIVGENLIRRVIDFSNSESAIEDLIKMWRGR